MLLVRLTPLLFLACTVDVPVLETNCTDNPLIIDGRATVVEQAGGNIVAVAGGAEFGGTIDSFGRYRVNVCREDPASVVALRATSSDKPSLVFASILGTAERLRDQANSFGVVYESANHALLVTELSTARYAALYAANGGRVPASESELEGAKAGMAEQLLGKEMYDVAATLRMVRDGDLQLPSAYRDTLALAHDIAALRTFVPGLFESDSVAAKVLDPSREALFLESENQPMPNVPLVAHVELFKRRNGLIGHGRKTLDFIPGLPGQPNEGIGFLSGNQPTRPELQPIAPFRWSIDESSIEIQLDAPLAIDGWSQSAQEIVAALNDPNLDTSITAALGSDTVEIPRELLAIDAAALHVDRHKAQWMAARETVRWRYDLALAQFGITARAVDLPAVPEGALWAEHNYESTPLTEADVTGTWAMQIVASTERASVDGRLAPGALLFATALVTFAPGGAASATVLGVSSQTIGLAWSINAVGGLRITYPNGFGQVFSQLDRIGASHGLLSSYEFDVVDFVVHYQRSYAAAVKLDPSFEFELTPNQSGEFLQSSINLNSAFRDAGGSYPDWALYGYRFENGTDVTRVRSTPDASDRTFSWTAVDGNIHIEQRYDRNRAARCSTSDPSCLTVRRRVWQPVAAEDGLIFFIESESFISEYVRRGQYEWSDAESAWVDATGDQLDAGSFDVLISDRLVPYWVSPLPE